MTKDKNQTGNTSKMPRTMAAIMTVSLLLTLALAACGNPSQAAQSESASPTTGQETAAASGAEEQSAAVDPGSVQNQTSAQSLSAAEEPGDTEKVPAVQVVTYSDDNLNLRCGGFQVLTEGFDALSNALHSYNAETKELALSFREDLEESPDYLYEGTATVTRCDAQIFSCKQERYVYLGMSDARPMTYGNTYDVETGEELMLWDILTDDILFEKTVFEKLEEHPDRSVFPEDWEDTVGSAIWGDVGMGWYLTDEGMEVCFGRGVANPTDRTIIRIPYEECEDFLDSGVIRKSDRICHLADDYGIYCLEYRFDADGDGKEEILQLDSDFEVDENNSVLGVRPIISFGKDEGSLKTVYGDSALEMKSAWVMESAGGKFYLYEETTEAEDCDALRIYDLSDPEVGPLPLGDNKLGAFYSFIPADPDHVYLEKRGGTAGSASGYLLCRVGEDGQLTAAGDGEYHTIASDDSGLFDPREEKADSSLSAPCEDLLKRCTEILTSEDPWELDEDASFTALCEIASACAPEEALRSVGYAVRDLNCDGTDELIIGSMYDDELAGGCQSNPIYNIFTIDGNSAKLLFQGWSRNRCYEMQDDFFLNEGSSGASSSFFGEFCFEYHSHPIQMDWAICRFTEYDASDGTIHIYKNQNGSWDSAASEEEFITEDQFWESESQSEQLAIHSNLTSLQDYNMTVTVCPLEDYGKEADSCSWVSLDRNYDAQSHLVFQSKRDVTDVKIFRLSFTNVDGDGNPVYDAQLLYEQNILSAALPLGVDLTFAGDLSCFGLSYRDTDGTACSYILAQSGRDGSYFLTAGNF